VNVTYFNHVSQIAKGRWDRRRFVAQWWRLYAGDTRWVPPYYPTLRRELEPTHNSHIARMAPVLLHVEALLRDKRSAQHGHGLMRPLPTPVLLEQPVAAAVALLDPRRKDGTAYLTLLHCVNDPLSLSRLLDHAAEALWTRGCRRLIGPTGLSPHLGTGLLQDWWDELPPLHSPYDPPYMPEIVGSAMETLGRSRLYHLEIPPERPPTPSGPAQLRPLEPARLATEFLPLLAAACPPWADLPPPDAEEAAFILRWVGRWPLHGWLAQVEGQPVGFVLLQPDLAPALRRARGGRSLLRRLWLAWASRRPARQGRLLYGAVLPQWRGQGIGRQLLHQAIATGQAQGWQAMSIGPLPTTAAAGAFLEGHGARPRQTYLLYRKDL
jgi:GNAT superfamily N-acetyltransferase